MGLLKNSTVQIVIAVIVLVLSLAIVQRCTTPEYIETVKTEVRMDSTKVDSLQKVIEKLESIPPDTTIIEVPIPVPVKTDTSFKYTIPYSDSLMRAIWKIESRGELIDFKYEYYYHSRFVREVNNTISEKSYFTKVQTITKVKQPRAYLSAGAEFALLGDKPTFSPKVSYTTQSQETFSFRYDIVNNGYAFSYTRPIKLRFPF